MRYKTSKSIVSASILLVSLYGTVVSANQWSPELTERVYRLPADQMERVIDRDFNRSDLARSIRESAEQLGSAQSKIVNVQDQSKLVDPQSELSLELRHQEVLAKKNYVDTLRDKIELEKNQLSTKKRFLERLADQAKREKFSNRNTREVTSLRREAKARIDLAPVDVSSFRAPGNRSNHVREEYDQNLEAIRSLQEAIANHQMNTSNGSESGDREAQISQMIADVDLELSAVQMREEMLVHMVKLLSLDAMQLAQDVEMFELEQGDDRSIPEERFGPNVQLFLSQR